MAISVAALLDDIRRVVQDRGNGAVRYADADLLTSLDVAIAELRRLRPDVFWRVSVEPATPSGQFTIDDSFRFFLSHFAAGYTLLQNTDYSVSQGAAALMDAARSTAVRTVRVSGG